MRPTAVVLFAVLIGAASGCSSKKPPVLPAPPTERIVLHGVVDFDKSKIRPDSLGLLDEAAARLKENVNLRVIVEGHSDSKGDEAYNRKLSLRRATTVRDYLVRQGVAGDRVLVVGKGSREPIASNATRAGRAQNRRVVLVVYQE